jgi:hypothetical protein
MPVIRATWEADIRGIKVPGQPRQNSSRDPILIHKKLCVMVHACDPSYSGSATRRIVVLLATDWFWA